MAFYSEFYPISDSNPGAIDFNTLARETGYYFTELLEVAEILQTFKNRPPTKSEILAEMSNRNAPKMKIYGKDDESQEG